MVPRFAIALACMSLMLAWARASAAASSSTTLKLATWNLEWLLTPETARDLRNRCQRGDGRRLPCDVVQGKPRSEPDLRALRRYAKSLDADVLALQEVENAAAAARVLPGYEFCFTQRRDLQNVGFAVRAGLPHRCDPDFIDLSLKDRVRRGATVTVYPGDSRELHLLAVHLKSGCSRDPLDSPAASCRQLAGQAPALARWIDTQVAAGAAFAVLGDFNRDLRSERAAGDGLWSQLADGQPRNENLLDAGGASPFTPCHSGQNFTRYIDYILLGGSLGGRLVNGSFSRTTFRAEDAYHFRLSDHCPLSVRVKLR